MTSKPPAHDAFLTTEEVLEYLQVNLGTVYRLIKSKSIPAVRVGRQWRFKKQDIDAWLEAAKAEPPVVMVADGSCSWTMMRELAPC